MVSAPKLELSQACFDEIRQKLLDSGYDWMVDEAVPDEIWIERFILVRETKPNG